MIAAGCCTVSGVLLLSSRARIPQRLAVVPVIGLLDNHNARQHSAGYALGLGVAPDRIDVPACRGHHPVDIDADRFHGGAGAQREPALLDFHGLTILLQVAEGMPAGELKHGTLSLIEEGTPVVVICPADYTYRETLGNAIEAKSRGAHIIAVSDEDNEIYDNWIKIPKVHELLYPMVAVIPLQLLAYYLTIQRGYDPDKPRNLAKSVTVK